MANDINSIMAGWVDRGPWQYYDTVSGAAGAVLLTSYSVFSVPIGQQDPVTAAVKTKLQTNMQRGNQFPPPRCLVLQQLGFYFSSKMLKTDIDNILDACYIEFRIDEKIYFEGQLWQYPAGVGLSGFSTKTSESFYTNGVPMPQATRRYGDYSKYIAPLQQFSLTILFPGTPPTLTATASGGAGMTLVPFMDGLTDRAVQ
jgi:hypothetical protein